jgi:hypothetical protein
MQMTILGASLLSTTEQEGMSAQYLRQEQIFHPKNKRKYI